MVSSLVVVTGPAQSGKTQYLLSRYRAALRGGKPGSVLWLAPTWRAAAEVRNRIPGDDLSACWEPGVFTFDKFAQAILDSSSESARPKGTLPYLLHGDHKGTVPFSPAMQDRRRKIGKIPWNRSGL